MFSIEQAKKYCCEDICLIENYDKASKDLIEKWDLHHRMEEEGYSVKELKDKGLYYGRPASELKFLTKKEHRSLHMNGKTGEKCHNSKQVLQIDKQTGQIIKTWPCTMEIQRVLSINQSHISQCCLGKQKSCGGYIWRYANNESLI